MTATVHSMLTARLERSLEGYARMSVRDAFHYFRRSNNPEFLESCSHCSLLPIRGAKLRKREDLPEGAKVCVDCERSAR